MALWWNADTTVLEAVARKEYASASLVKVIEFNFIAKESLIMISIKEIKDEVEEHISPKVKWYLKYRTQIWAVIFFIIGTVGGNVATVQKYVPALKYDTVQIEQKLQQLDAVSEKLIKIQETLDKLVGK